MANLYVETSPGTWALMVKNGGKLWLVKGPSNPSTFIKVASLYVCKYDAISDSNIFVKVADFPSTPTDTPATPVIHQDGLTQVSGKVRCKVTAPSFPVGVTGYSVRFYRANGLGGWDQTDQITVNSAGAVCFSSYAFDPSVPDQAKAGQAFFSNTAGNGPNSGDSSTITVTDTLPVP